MLCVAMGTTYFVSGSVYFFFELQPCYGAFLVPPSTDKTCVVYLLKPLDSAYFFCFLYLANFQKVETRLLTAEKVLIGIKTLHIWISQKRGTAQSRNLGKEQVGIVLLIIKTVKILCHLHTRKKTFHHMHLSGRLLIVYCSECISTVIYEQWAKAY